MMSCKRNGNFASLGIVGATSDDNHSVRLWKQHGAGEQKTTGCLMWGMLWERCVVTDVLLTDGTVVCGLGWVFSDDDEEPGNCRITPVG